MKYIICDLDGTLCDIEHRRHYVEGEKKDWDAFYTGIPNDQVNEVIKTILDDYRYGSYWTNFEIILVSGRPERCREDTVRWLEKNTDFGESEFYRLFMRKDGDFRPDDVVKAEIYDTLIEPEHGKPLFVLDDRDKVVKMWRSKGLVCLQVAEGNF